MTTRALVLALLLVTASGEVLGQTGVLSLKPDTNTERELRALRRDFMEALRSGDRPALERISTSRADSKIGDGVRLVQP